MIITLTIIGIIFVVYGSLLIMNNKKPNFMEFLEKAEKRDDANNILKKINVMDDKINHLVNVVEKLGKGNESIENHEVKGRINTSLKKEVFIEDNIKDEPIKEEKIKDEVITNKPILDDKKELMIKIRNMVKENKSIEEIANTLKLGKGEVLFLLNLSKKN